MPFMRHSRTNATSLVVIVASFVRRPGISSCQRVSSWAYLRCRIRLAVSGGAIRRNRYGRGAPRPTALASAPRLGRPSTGLGVAHDLTRVADRLQIAGDDFVERRSFRAGDLDNAVSRRRERDIGNDGSNVVRRDGLEQGGLNPDYVSIST